MKNLIVYYSWTGNTEVVAKVLHQLVGGELKKIEEKKQRKTGIGFAGAAFSAFLGLKSRLKPMDFSLKNYDNIFLGGPVWAACSAPPMNSFIRKANLKGKKVYLLLTKADEKIPKRVIDSIIKRVEKCGGKVVDSISVTTVMNSVITPEAVKESISEWIKKSTID